MDGIKYSYNDVFYCSYFILNSGKELRYFVLCFKLIPFHGSFSQNNARSYAYV